MVASQHNPLIRQFCRRLVACGKPKKVALVACVRKLLYSATASGSIWSDETLVRIGDSRSSPVKHPTNSQSGCCKILAEVLPHSKAGFE